MRLRFWGGANCLAQSVTVSDHSRKAKMLPTGRGLAAFSAVRSVA